ncbi:MAG TPA: hypothetical protein VJH94_05560 [Candidatus Paceibacterota bacterium]
MLRRFENPFDAIRKGADGDETVLQEARRLEKENALGEIQISQPRTIKNRATTPKKEAVSPIVEKDSWIEGHEARQDEYASRFEGNLGPDKVFKGKHKPETN